jgi:hypothetical protein
LLIEGFKNYKLFLLYSFFSFEIFLSSCTQTFTNCKLDKTVSFYQNNRICTDHLTLHLFSYFFEFPFYHFSLWSFPLCSAGILENYQETVKIKYHYSRLPLHIAFQFKATEDVIRMLFASFPLAAEVQDASGRLLLHYALQFNAPVRILKLLVTAYPVGLQVQDDDGSLTIHLAVQNKVSDDVLKRMLAVYSEAFKVQDNDGSLPIHLAKSYM